MDRRRNRLFRQLGARLVRGSDSLLMLTSSQWPALISLVRADQWLYIGKRFATRQRDVRDMATSQRSTTKPSSSTNRLRSLRAFGVTFLATLLVFGAIALVSDSAEQIPEEVPAFSSVDSDARRVEMTTPGELLELDSVTIPATPWAVASPSTLFVLDPRDGHQTSRVVALDAETGNMVGSVPSGNAPDLAVGGSVVFVASYEVDNADLKGGRHVLRAYDSSNGREIAARDVPDRMSWPLPTAISLIVASTDGQMVFVHQLADAADIEANPWGVQHVSAFALKGNELSFVGSVEITGCRTPISTGTGPTSLAVACSHPLEKVIHLIDFAGSPDITTITIDPEALASDHPVSGINASRLHFDLPAGVHYQAQSENVVVVYSNGVGLIVDSRSRTVSSFFTIDLMASEWIPAGSTSLTADRAGLLIGVGRSADVVNQTGTRYASSLMKLDLGSLDQGNLAPSIHVGRLPGFLAVATTPTGQVITVNPFSRSLVQLDDSLNAGFKLHVPDWSPSQLAGSP